MLPVKIKIPFLDPNSRPSLVAVGWCRFFPCSLALVSDSLTPRIPGSGLLGDVRAELALSMLFTPKKKWGQGETSDLSGAGRILLEKG